MSDEIQKEEDIVEDLNRPIYSRRKTTEPKSKITEEILLEGLGDDEFLQYALQYETIKQINQDFKFMVRLAARHARKKNLITAADQEFILDLIKQPVKKQSGKPYDAWQAFETECKKLNLTTLIAFEENWPNIIEILSAILSSLDSLVKIKRRGR